MAPIFPERLRPQVVAARQSIGRVNAVTAGADTQLRGTCFLVGRRHAITCDHVADLKGSPAEDDAERSAASLEVVFEGALRRRIRASVVLSGGLGIDLAVLELAEDPGVPPIQVAFSPLWGSAFCSFGYPIEPGGS